MQLTLCASLHKPLTSPLLRCMPLDWFAVSDSFLCEAASTATSKQVAALAKVLRVLWSKCGRHAALGVMQNATLPYTVVHAEPVLEGNSQSILLVQRQQHRKQRLCRCSSRFCSWRPTCKMPQLDRRQPLTASTAARTNSATAKGDPTCN